jgi:hypothetical protein
MQAPIKGQIKSASRDLKPLYTRHGMVLELHVWGPAFSLPSIDAQCIAAVAYMTQAVPRGEWSLVASSDPSPSPTRMSKPSPAPALTIHRICRC